MSENSRISGRRAARKRSSSRLAAFIGAALGCLLLVAVIAFTWSKLAPHSQSSASTSTKAAVVVIGSQASSSTAKKSETKATTTEAAAQSAMSIAPTAADDVASAASKSAVHKAAVPFPGAPALPATTKSINHLNPRHKYIAITLDDGYGFQTKMLDLLEQYHAHCTTFLIGQWAAQNKPILKRLNKDGFEIGNHTWDHKPLTKMSSSQIVSELAKTQTIISSVTGNQAPYLRPPGGATNTSVRQVAASRGYRVIMWNRTFGDSGGGPTPTKLYNNAVVANGGVQPGDIILCHWGSKMSYQAMKRVLPYLKAQGYEIVTISELIADSKGVK